MNVRKHRYAKIFERHGSIVHTSELAAPDSIAYSLHQVQQNKLTTHPYNYYLIYDATLIVQYSSITVYGIQFTVNYTRKSQGQSAISLANHAYFWLGWTKVFISHFTRKS